MLLIEIDTPGVKISTVEDGGGSSSDLIEKAELATEQETTIKSGKGMETAPKVNESTEKDVKDIGLNPIEDGYKGLTSWPVEFKRLQREIIKLWHACNISLAHRTYFFLLFQGDPSDAIYLEIEMRRIKFLKEKFSRGEKANVNGKRLTLSSSAKSLRRERRMLTEQMSKKFSEHERENLFLDWGIGLNTKLRRQQLANLIWSKTEDINHIADSAVLVAKLVGFIEPGQAPKKEMFGLNFAPKGSTGVCSFKRSLEFLLPGNTLGTAEGFSASEAGFCSLAFVSDVSDFSSGFSSAAGFSSVSSFSTSEPCFRSSVFSVSEISSFGVSVSFSCAFFSASEAVFLVSGVSGFLSSYFSSGLFSSGFHVVWASTFSDVSSLVTSASPSPAFFCDASASTFWLAGFTPTSSEVLVSRPSGWCFLYFILYWSISNSFRRGSHHSDEPQNLRFLLLDYGNTIRNSSIITAMITDAAAFAAPLLQYHHLTFLDLKVQNLPWTTSVLKTEFIPMGS
ncbi:Kinesin-like protein KIN-7G [Sesamum angolense]|uniref:Kinesin-like protein KIN-7G n=1 Tax=Sesamum angolense TaxID=2727404 RepID=A0AAE1VZJ7_9LAMI|nr:Kinesin-like protein KIN-7G [Sesamum angolense]